MRGVPYADHRGTRIRYEVEGDGPPLVLVHGFMSRLEDWSAYGYTADLAGDHRVIRFDARGHGGSDKPRGPEAYAPERLVGDVLAVLDDLGILKAGLMGYSLGGYIGSQILRYAPSRFTAVIIGAHDPCNAWTDAERELIRRREADFRFVIQNGVEAYIESVERKAGRRIADAEREGLLAMDPEALSAFQTAILRAEGVGDLLPSVRIPCLLYAGEADAWFERVRSAAGKIPGASFFSLPRLSHHEGFARSDLVLPPVRRFLADLPG